MYDSSTVQVHTPLISLFKKHGAFRPFERTKTTFKKKESVCAAPWYSSPKSQLGEPTHFAKDEENRGAGRDRKDATVPQHYVHCVRGRERRLRMRRLGSFDGL